MRAYYDFPPHLNDGVPGENSRRHKEIHHSNVRMICMSLAGGAAILSYLRPGRNSDEKSVLRAKAGGARPAKLAATSEDASDAAATDSKRVVVIETEGGAAARAMAGVQTGVTVF